MRCYRCNSLLDNNSDFCMKCGADVSVYKVVVHTSNIYYNQGLAKAKVRDLSGAVTSLKTSISINKKNIKARNLLGLVYYEMGEVVMALSEWVLSKNIRPDRNVADVYIKKLQDNPGKLENMNQAIKKFNISLGQAKDKNYDMALISLKKVVSMNPNLIKAQLLLALLHMQAGQNDKAVKCLNKVLKVDCNNTVALKYLGEINSEKKIDDELYFSKRRKKQANQGSDINGYIAPPNTYKEPSSGIFTVLSILLGVAIGAALIWYLVLPSKIANVNHDNNLLLNSYSEQISAGAIDSANLRDTIDNLNTRVEELTSELSIYIGEEGESNMYALLVDAAYCYINNDFANAVILLDKIDIALLPNQKAKDVYSIMNENLSGGADQFASLGAKAFKNNDYLSAISYYKAVLCYDGDNTEALYYLYVSEEANGDEDEALAGYREFVEKYPTSGFVPDVAARIEKLDPTPTEEETTQAEQPAAQ